MAFRSHCQGVEVLAFDREIATREVTGRTLVEPDNRAEPLPDVQVAVRSIENGHVTFAVSGADGTFSLGHLRPGVYEAWTCLDGYDGLEFRLRVAPDAPSGELQLFLAPSEAVATRDVRFVPAP